jgi:hypothetical protein
VCGFVADPAQRFGTAARTTAALHDVLAAHAVKPDPAAARRCWARLVAPHLAGRAADRGPTLS